MSVRRAGLGRGLRALVSEEALQGASRHGEPLMVPVESISLNPEQPRSQFDAQALEALRCSIEEHGVLNPLWVRLEGHTHQLIAGERRLRAAKLARLREVPVVVLRQADSPAQRLKLALIENLQREDLNPVEAAIGFQRLMQTFGMSVQQVAEIAGKDRSTVANLVRLLKLPGSVLELISCGSISAGHGRALLPLVGHGRFEEVVSKVQAQGLSVRALEAWVRQLLGPVVKPTSSAKFTDLSERLSAGLATKVQVRPSKSGDAGSIVIRYGSVDELERLAAHLNRGG